MKLLELLYQLNAQKILLWYKNNENLGFSILKNSEFPSYLKEQVQHNKSALLEILDYNCVYSEEEAESVSFYRIPEYIRSHTLSAVQKGIYLQSTLDKLSYTYNVPIFIEFSNPDIEVIKNAVICLLTNYSILRMAIQDNFSYTILPIDDFQVPCTSISCHQMEEVLKNRYERAFDVTGGKLIQTEIICVEEKNIAILNLTHHHI